MIEVILHTTARHTGVGIYFKHENNSKHTGTLFNK